MKRSVLWIATMLLFGLEHTIAENTLTIPTFMSATIGKTFVLPVEMRNSDSNITAFQFSLKLPEGFSIATRLNDDQDTIYQVELTDRKKSSHSISCKYYKDTHILNVVVSSMSNQTFRDSSGTIMNITVYVDKTIQTGTKDITLSNIVLANSLAEKYTSSDCTSSVNVLPSTCRLAIQINGNGKVLGAGTYDESTQVNLVAEPEERCTFIGWYAGTVQISTNTNYSFIIDSDTTLTATFTTKPYYITVQATPGGTVNGNGTYSEGSSVSVTAIPASGYKFVGWYSESNLKSTNPNYTFTATSDLSLTAKFQSILPKPVITSDNGVLNITDEVEGATIYYTLDSSTPSTSSNKYDGPIKLNFSSFVKAFATKDGYGNSEVATSTITVYKHDTISIHDTINIEHTDTLFIEKHDTLKIGLLPKAPVIKAEGNMVTITCETEGVNIYYSTDGSTNLNNLYNSPFEIKNSTIVIAKAVFESPISTLSIQTAIQSATRKMTSQRFYLENGVEINSLARGINIIRTFYNDGSMETAKVFVK
ncbi:MAG: chitobiase/beta-hexosaminidase C-terminal domain-containing protein [Bacteroidota bacterium]|nr:chitobiase/beta-hexosaminidase C-terminal domain-containing protein [Bacteroidota bacterium]